MKDRNRINLQSYKSVNSWIGIQLFQYENFLLTDIRKRVTTNLQMSCIFGMEEFLWEGRKDIGQKTGSKF